MAREITLPFIIAIFIFCLNKGQAEDCLMKFQGCVPDYLRQLFSGEGRLRIRPNTYTTQVLFDKFCDEIDVTKKCILNKKTDCPNESSDWLDKYTAICEGSSPFCSEDSIGSCLSILPTTSLLAANMTHNQLCPKLRLFSSCTAAKNCDHREILDRLSYENAVAKWNRKHGTQDDLFFDCEEGSGNVSATKVGNSTYHNADYLLQCSTKLGSQGCRYSESFYTEDAVALKVSSCKSCGFDRPLSCRSGTFLSFRSLCCEMCPSGLTNNGNKNFVCDQAANDNGQDNNNVNDKASGISYPVYSVILCCALQALRGFGVR